MEKFLRRPVIVPKKSKWEMDQEKWRLSESGLRKHYFKNGMDAERIYQSHVRQQETISLLKEFFPSSAWCERDGWSQERARNSSLVVAVGGDNHFQFVSHFVERKKIIGINSDPFSSEGAILSFAPEDIPRLVRELENNTLTWNRWSRVQVWKNGKKLGPPALSEVFLGEQNRLSMSRHILKHGKMTEEQKSSGLLVTTGVGQTGWFHSAMSPRRIKHISPAENCFLFGATEPFAGRLSRARLTSGIVRGRGALRVQSLNDEQGIIGIDSWRTFDFLNGQKAVIRLGVPLLVGARWK